MRALEAAMKADQTLFLIPQKDLLVDDPKLKDLYAIGTVAKVKQVLKTQGENLRILVTGVLPRKDHRAAAKRAVSGGLGRGGFSYKVHDNVRAMLCAGRPYPCRTVFADVGASGQAIQLRMMASEDTGFVADAIAQNL